MFHKCSLFSYLFIFYLSNTSPFLAFLNAHKVIYVVDTNMNADYTKAYDGWLFLNWWTSPILLHTLLSSGSYTDSSTSTGRAPTHSLKGHLTDHDITCSVHSLCYRWTFCSFWFPFFATITMSHFTFLFIRPCYCFPIWAKTLAVLAERKSLL